MASQQPAFFNSKDPGNKETTHSSQVEIAFVLFMDLVGYSLKPIEQQIRITEQLGKIVRETDDYQRAHSQGNLVSLPTGDGLALVFFADPIAPIQCAIEICRALKQFPEIELRMGVNSGPVSRIPDINEQRNVAGNGIDMAQRVMSCGDAGHILVSLAVADVLRHLSNWAPWLHDLGERRVKHGVKIHLFNLYGDDIGNARIPGKFSRTRRWLVMMSVLALLAGATAVISKTDLLDRRSNAIPSVPNRTLTYHLMVQKYRNNKPFRQPFRIGREMIVEAGDRIQFAMSSALPGHLYLLNEGPISHDGLPSFNTLFPSPTGNSGSSFFKPYQEIYFPPTISLAFDEQEGTEKLWIIWSSQPLSQFEAMKKWTGPGRNGSVQDPRQLVSTRDFLRSSTLAAFEVDDANKQTRLSQSADPLIYLIRLEHH